ncbi:DUF1353 domain-containing protein [Pseudoroseicyclus aestuarii]|uniref:Uncharacterized protein DUF1353 n=1 Tax=Pseudoroseicyclus aestuarii TaxID=1795041 RepID=A0A318SM94_9RHOB|nr:DUF1353 domain-containing protein [Pseudoroseicyclus aestuarii]PYE80805.1 uncharacterized protein DUF1353 [Pseudoroseicyclus aestuarii]
MSAYTAAAAWYELAEGLRYRVTVPLRWEIGREGGPAVTVPPGFVFDVSVPRGLRWIVSPRDARYLKAAALHDWLLEDGWARVTAAAVFNEALAADGVGRLRRLAMWLAVSLWRWS